MARTNHRRSYYDTPGRVRPMGGSKSSDEVIVTKPDGTTTVEKIPNSHIPSQTAKPRPAKQRHKAALNDVMGRTVAQPNQTRDRWLAVRHIVVTRDKGICRYCREEPGEVADLIVHEADGGTVNAGNAVAACTRCHAISLTLRAETFEERQGYVLWQREGGR